MSNNSYQDWYITEQVICNIDCVIWQFVCQCVHSLLDHTEHVVSLFPSVVHHLLFLSPVLGVVSLCDSPQCGFMVGNLKKVQHSPQLGFYVQSEILISDHHYRVTMVVKDIGVERSLPFFHCLWNKIIPFLVVA